MELSNKQQLIVNSTISENVLIEGYSGVGKTTALLKKYEKLYADAHTRNETVYIVSDELKKMIALNHYNKFTSKYNVFNIYSMNELIHKYLKRMNLPLFENTINPERKKEFIEDIMEYLHNDLKIDFTVEFVLNEINFIQENICVKENESMEEVLKIELKQYLNKPRKSFKKGLLSFREKQYIWSIYNEFLNKVLNEDLFDEQTFYQSFLRLLYQHYEHNELALTFSIILVDDTEDFTRVELDILYYLYNQNSDKHSLLLTYDDLKAKDKYRNFKNSILFKAINNSVTLDVNYRNSRNVFNIIKANMTNNEIINAKLNYTSQYNKMDNKSVLTYFYNKSMDEKQEVFFDRLDLLINNMDYKLSDILVIFYDEKSLKDVHDLCLQHKINVITIYEHFENSQNDALTFITKNELVSCDYKVVILYDADNKKLCVGPINRIINIANNYIDSIYFYLSTSIAKDFLIINSSVADPSHLLLPSNINYDDFVFEVASKFHIKSTLTIYRKSEFIVWIKENLIKNYNYNSEDFSVDLLFDFIIKDKQNLIGIKILDNNIDNELIGKILQNGQNLSHVVIYDINHYLTFKNVNNEFVRIKDIPNK
ncbi:MAG: LexA repressor [Haloplasmataceae bacterium]|nr:LexA repressor [Haloplasmataceae bacterium]